MVRWFIICMQVMLPSWHFSVKASQRTRTKRYAAKRAMVKNFWIVAGLMMVVVPVAHFVMALLLFTTFVHCCPVNFQNKLA